MGILEEIKFGEGVGQANQEALHEAVGKDAALLLERWQGDCGMCHKKE